MERDTGQEHWNNLQCVRGYTASTPRPLNAVYFPDGCSVGVDLRGADGELRVQWLDVIASQWLAGAPLCGRGTATLAAPGACHRVELIRHW